MNKLRFCLVYFSLLVLVLGAAAQVQNGQFTGTVADPSGAGNDTGRPASHDKGRDARDEQSHGSELRRDQPGEGEGGEVGLNWLRVRGHSIAGGSNEIQRNIIAKTVLMI